MILLIDNYDSFTYNLYDYLAQLYGDVQVVLNDQISIKQIQKLAPKAIVLSPGPETPYEAGITMEVIQQFHQKLPFLGVCLGHQALGLFFGATLTQLAYPMHGKTSSVFHIHDPIFHNIPQPFEAMRYHSLFVENLDKTALLPIASTLDGINMAFRHAQLPIYGLQFHPESILSLCGKKILENWLKLELEK